MRGSFSRRLGSTLWAGSAAAGVTLLNAQTAAKPLVAHETSLGRRRPEIVSQTLATSAAMRLAYVVKTATGEAVVLDGVVGRTYSAIPRTRLTEAGITPPIGFSPDGKRIAYVAVKSNRSFVVVDGVEEKGFDRVSVGAPIFSPDGRHVAYIAERTGKSLVVIDGVEGPAFDDIGEARPKFTSDSKHFVYSGRRGKRGFIVVDRKEVGDAEFVGSPVSSDSGERIAYVRLENDGKSDWWSVVVDGVQGKPYRHIGNNLVFSRDGRHFLYRGGDSLDYVVVDGVPGRGFGTIKENSYAFSRDGSHVAFVAEEDGQEFWVLDGKPEKSYEWISTEPAFSPDGRRLTYAARRGGNRFVVIGGREGEPFDDITVFPKFGRDGRVIYIARRGPWQYVGVDGAARPFNQVADAFITAAGRLVVIGLQGTWWNAIVEGAASKSYAVAPGPVAVSPDGRRIAYAAGRDSKRLVVVDGIEGRLYDEVRHIGFSPDGWHVVYAAMRSGRYVVVADGAESPAYDEIVSFPYADELGPESLTMLARRGSEDLKVVIEWKDK